jgi:tRNA A37 threonylcarbamoyladenosine dehydratase
MNPVISKGATPPCEAGIVAGVGGVSGFCAQTLAAINNKAVAIILFPEVCNLNNI